MTFSLSVNPYKSEVGKYVPSLHSLTLVFACGSVSTLGCKTFILCSFLETKVLGSHLPVASVYQNFTHKF